MRDIKCFIQWNKFFTVLAVTAVAVLAGAVSAIMNVGFDAIPHVEVAIAITVISEIIVIAYVCYFVYDMIAVRVRRKRSDYQQNRINMQNAYEEDQEYSWLINFIEESFKELNLKIEEHLLDNWIVLFNFYLTQYVKKENPWSITNMDVAAAFMKAVIQDNRTDKRLGLIMQVLYPIFDEMIDYFWRWSEDKEKIIITNSRIRVNTKSNLKIGVVKEFGYEFIYTTLRNNLGKDTGIDNLTKLLEGFQSSGRYYEERE